METLILVWQSIIYGALGKKPRIDLDALPAHLNFVSHYDPSADLHWLECPQLPEFYVTGHDKKELAKNVTDTILVYFDVPTYFARKFRPTNMKFTFENKKTGEQEYISLDYMEELSRALA